MPRRQRVWSSWNFSGDAAIEQQSPPVCVTYWMNSLQRLATERDYFVTLNPVTEPEERHIIEEFQYDHPMFGSDAVTAQKLINSIQGQQHTWYCGAWLGYGFHEDGLKSGIQVATALGATVPWESSATTDDQSTIDTQQRQAA